MLLKTLFLTCVCSIWALPAQQVSPRINGSLATRGQFPWQVGLYITKNTGIRFCGGAIISETWVLTAAHCVWGAYFRIKVLLGTTSSEGNDPDQLELHAVEWIRHEDWDQFDLENDIGVVKLPTSLVFNDYIKSVALPSEDIQQAFAVVSGWGNDQSNIGPDLRYFHLTIDGECDYGKLCGFSTDPGNQLCYEDSGDAVVTDDPTEPILVAVVTYFYSGCQNRSFDGLTNVAAYRYWIQENTGV